MLKKKNIEKNGKICKKKNMKKLAYSLIKRGCIKIVFKYLLVTVYRSINNFRKCFRNNKSEKFVQNAPFCRNELIHTL